MGILNNIFKKKTENNQSSQDSNLTIQTKEFMTSQFPALYLKEDNDIYRKHYLKRLCDIGIKRKNAEIMFDFECEIIKKFNKDFLLHPGFTKMWCFGLTQPFFQQYPQKKEDILKEHFFTMSELCKMIDEAEWHIWNSHERVLSKSVWQEICDWRMKGEGMDFAVKYFDMIVEETGISTDDISKLCAEQGEHLCKYKW